MRHALHGGGAMLDTLATTKAAGQCWDRPDDHKRHKPITRKPKKKIITVSLKINGLGNNTAAAARHLRVIIIYFFL